MRKAFAFLVVGCLFVPCQQAGMSPVTYSFSCVTNTSQENASKTEKTQMTFSWRMCGNEKKTAWSRCCKRLLRKDKKLSY